MWDMEVDSSSTEGGGLEPPPSRSVGAGNSNVEPVAGFKRRRRQVDESPDNANTQNRESTEASSRGKRGAKVIRH